MSNYNTPPPEVLTSPRDAALYYRDELGWPTIPVGPGKKALQPWKKLQKELPTKDYIVHCYEKFPTAGVAILTGGLADLVVMDIDLDRGGLETVQALLKDGTISHEELESPRARTQSGGGHVYFAHPGIQISNRVDLWPGIDIRGDGGYVVAPPTSFPTGGYKWTKGHAPWEIKLAKCPSELLIKVTVTSKNLSGDALAGLLLPKLLGQRTDATKRVVGHYCALGLPKVEILQLLKWWNEKKPATSRRRPIPLSV